MASNIFWGHVGSIVSALLAGVAGYVLYPDIKYCFLVIGVSALMAVGGVQFLPEGDPLMGRGLQTHPTDNAGTGALDGEVFNNADDSMKNDSNVKYVNMDEHRPAYHTQESEDKMVSSYWSVFGDRRTVVLCATGFFFQ